MPPISPTTQPIALSIAGSDCSAGAGVQADLKTLQQLGVHGLSAVTSIVSETPLEVRDIEAIATSLVQSQIQILLETYPIAAIKTGMLPSRSSIIAVCEILKDHSIPIITDPVMIASSGSALMQDDASLAMAERLIPLCTLVTPNMPEASQLLGREVQDHSDLEQAARDIGEKFQTSCLLKGGHLPSGVDRLDILWHKGKSHTFTHPDADIAGGIHGTGCTLSASITGHLALGKPLEQAVENAISHVQKLIANAKTWQHGGQAVRCLGW